MFLVLKSSLCSDHDGEFVNHHFQNFCTENGIAHKFSFPRTPKQNSVLECKNRVLEELTRTMINEISLPKYFLEDATNTACHVLNRVIIRSIIEKTPYEILKGKKPNISYFQVFGYKCFILNNKKDKLGKGKLMCGIFSVKKVSKSRRRD